MKVKTVSNLQEISAQECKVISAGHEIADYEGLSLLRGGTSAYGGLDPAAFMNNSSNRGAPLCNVEPMNTYVKVCG